MRGKSAFLVLLAVVALLSIGVWAPAQNAMQGKEQSPAARDMNQPNPAMSQPETTGQESAMSTEARVGSFRPDVIRAKDLIGMKVVDKNHEDIGKLEEVVLNGKRDKIAFGVMSSGGFLGMGESHLVVAPWSSLEKSPAEKTLVLNKTKAELREAPHFDKSNWPNLSSKEWRDKVRTAFGRESAKEETTESETAATTEGTRRAPESRRLTKLMDMKVEGRNNQEIGKLKDVAVDMREGRLVYGIVGLKDKIEGKDMAAIPWDSLTIRPDTMTAQVQVDPSKLVAVAFIARNFPDLNSREYASRVYSTFDRQPYWTTYGYVGPGKETGAAPMRMAWGTEGAYAKMYDPKSVSTIQGTIISVGTFEPEKGARPGRLLEVKTADGQTIKVHLGPRAFLERQKIAFKKGEQVTITGSRTQFEGSPVVIASNVKAGEKTIQLRDDQGKPLWHEQEMKSERRMERKEKGY